MAKVLVATGTGGYEDHRDDPTSSVNTGRDIDGRHYAFVAAVVPGSVIQVDDGFECMEAWSKKTVRVDEFGLYVDCDEGGHYLEGQIEVSTDGKEFYIGMYSVR